MKPLTSAEITGNWGTLLLPINQDESIDWARLEDELEFILDARVDGVYTNGTAGEFLTQTEEEFVRISKLVAEKCEARKIPFQIGASHASAQTMIERARIAGELNCGAVQVILPDWVAVTIEEAETFLKKIAETIAPIGIVLYNPPHAKKVLSPREFERLKRAVPQLVGVKVMDGDENWYREMREYCADLSVFVPGHKLASGFKLGASGAYSNVACLHPRAAQNWWKLMQTDIARAIALENDLKKFFQAAITPLGAEEGYSNSALDKTLAAVGGWANVGTRLRFPYRFVPEEKIEEIKHLADEFLAALLRGERN